MWHWLGDGGKGSKDMVLLPYRDRLATFSRYLQQLVMESLGKKLDRDGQVVNQGIAVYGNKGSTDQHAYVQQLRDGVDNFFVTFIEALDDPTDIPALHGERPGDVLEGFLLGTRTALMESGRQSMAITLRRFDAQALGALVALFERAVGFYGELVNINAYNQPGVEAGKLAAASILDLQAELEGLMADGHTRTLEQLQQGLEAKGQTVPSPEPIFWILRHLSANQPSLRVVGDWGQPDTLQVTLQPASA
jgi:glucose-6-phosphate isomerase